jgi:hypothetical protein
LIGISEPQRWRSIVIEHAHLDDVGASCNCPRWRLLKRSSKGSAKSELKRRLLSLQHDAVREGAPLQAYATK